MKVVFSTFISSVIKYICRQGLCSVYMPLLPPPPFFCFGKAWLTPTNGPWGGGAGIFLKIGVGGRKCFISFWVGSGAHLGLNFGVCVCGVGGGGDFHPAVWWGPVSSGAKFWRGSCYTPSGNHDNTNDKSL